MMVRVLQDTARPQRLKRGAVRSVSEYKTPSGDGKTRPWHGNVRLLTVKAWHHASCNLSMVFCFCLRNDLRMPLLCYNFDCDMWDASCLNV